jgi:3-deoxy-D-manno-octulosonate 8-phosphate phosphatase (KDO 8-P phosphatase)
MAEAAQNCPAGGQQAVWFKKQIANKSNVIDLEPLPFAFSGSDGAKLCDNMKSKTLCTTHWPVKVALILFDFDGVLTDNHVWVAENGAETVCCNRADGLGFNLLRAAGIACVIVSTETNPVVTHRARKLGVPVVQSVTDKGEAVRKICRERGVDLDRVAFVGNDLNDLPAMTVTGISLCPSDAAREVREICTYVLKAKGGQGVVREIAAGLGTKWIAQT